VQSCLLSEVLFLAHSAPQTIWQSGSDRTRHGSLQD